MSVLLALVVGLLLGLLLAGLLAVRRVEAARHEAVAVRAELAAERRGAAERADDRVHLEARQRSVEDLVAPVRDGLGRVADELRVLEAARVSAYSGLIEQVRGLSEAQERLRRETGQLAGALRTPGIRGRWGEVQLRRVVELAGLVEHCDFVEQPTLGTPGQPRARPDLVVRLPGGGAVAVDAKVPLDAYLAAADLPEGSERAGLLDRHAAALRSHVQALAARTYWRELHPAPELVVLFLPSEAILAAALAARPGLYDEALGASVLLATPTTLIGLLKTIAWGWRQDRMADSARLVCDLGRTLHERLAALVGHVDKLGRSLDAAVGAYNSAVGTLESRVLVSARRLAEAGVTSGELPTPQQVERAARSVS